MIGERLKSLREGKSLTQAEIERRTGLLRCYISRVENGHTIPALPTLERMARALEVPLYQLFYSGEGPAKPPEGLQSRSDTDTSTWGAIGKDALLFTKLRRLLSQAKENDRRLLMLMAQKMARTVRRSPSKRRSRHRKNSSPN